MSVDYFDDITNRIVRVTPIPVDPYSTFVYDDLLISYWCYVRYFKKGRNNNDSFEYFDSNFSPVTTAQTAEFLVKVIRNRGYRLSSKNDFVYNADDDSLSLNGEIVYKMGNFDFNAVKRYKL